MPGQLTNRTGEPLLVYGPTRAGESQDNSLYVLANGDTTPPNWDCDGFYVPSDRKVSQLVLPTQQGPLAVKYVNVQTAEITRTGDTFDAPLNYMILRAGDENWPIPNIPAAKVGDYPSTPAAERPKEEEKSSNTSCIVIAVAVVVAILIIVIIIFT